MSQSFVSGGRIQLAKKLSPTDTTLTATTNIWITNGRLYFKNDSQEEWIDFSAVTPSGPNFVYTIDARSLSATAEPSTSTWTGLTWLASSIGYNVQMHDQMIDKRFWLLASYANAAARDAAIVTPINGMQVYLTAEGYFTDYNAWTWTQRANWATPNSSTSVAGKSQEWTAADNTAATEIWSTWAPLFMSPKNTSVVSTGAWDVGKVPILNTNWQLDNSFFGTSGFAWEMRMYWGAAAPTGWLICDWASLLRVWVYASLFAVIGTTFWSVDWTHFSVPDMRGRTPIGSGTGTATGATAHALWETPLSGKWWEEAHSMTLSELIWHTHTLLRDDPWIRGRIGQIPSYWVDNSSTWNSTTTVTTSSTWWGAAFNIMSPYTGVNFIIKY